MTFFKWIVSLFKRKPVAVDTKDYTQPSAFIHTWSVVDFARKHGKMQIGKFPDVNNRESFQRCRFVKNKDDITYAGISSALQGVTVKEVSEQRDRIRVGQLHNGKYVLYDFRWKDWEDVNLGI